MPTSQQHTKDIDPYGGLSKKQDFEAMGQCIPTKVEPRPSSSAGTNRDEPQPDCTDTVVSTAPVVATDAVEDGTANAHSISTSPKDSATVPDDKIGRTAPDRHQHESHKHAFNPELSDEELARLRVIPYPVQRLLKGKCELGSLTHQKYAKEATEYLLRLLPVAHLDSKLKENVRQILGLPQPQLYTSNLEWLQEWESLNIGCEKRMHTIGNVLEAEQYQGCGLANILGTFEPKLKVPAGVRVRQSVVPVQAIADSTGAHNDRLSSQLDLEYTYIHFLRMLALAFDKAFAKEINATIGELLVGNKVSTGGIKGYERIANKVSQCLTCT